MLLYVDSSSLDLIYSVANHEIRDRSMIPSGSYHMVESPPMVGHIAKLIGQPNYSRHVGQALKFLSPNTNPPVPWHRVIASSGAISSRGPGTNGAQLQQEALEAEGVEVTVGRTGELRVDMKTWGWFPAPGSIDIADAPSDDGSA
ncbi:hypothetical protein CCMSSC00406_0008343 [Pleurotus cornucopiae]|uniref:Uncharacterized protein n=1 Tax=Pleurotus cornucopiae TaxID=5321 RepID=A0ACB7IUV1_PLECO|nr:hypothetical protein CCMSSC00406_0008343 [Pleurotus cornucopiae]